MLEKQWKAATISEIDDAAVFAEETLLKKHYFEFISSKWMKIVVHSMCRKQEYPVKPHRLL